MDDWAGAITQWVFSIFTPNMATLAHTSLRRSSTKLVLAASVMFAIISIFSCADDLKFIEWTPLNLSGTCEWENTIDATSKMALVNESEHIVPSGIFLKNNEWCSAPYYLSLDGGHTIWDGQIPAWSADNMLITGIEAYVQCGSHLIGPLVCPSIKIKDPGKTGNSYFIDYRDGQIYQIFNIFGVTWMAENLNYSGELDDALGKCYDGKISSCNKYGRLYDQETAEIICPSGWHLPTENELKLGGGSLTFSDIQVMQLKAGAFAALLGGYGSNSTSIDVYGYIGDNGFWWGTDNMVLRFASSSGKILHNENKGVLYSVRCVKD